MAVMTIRGLDDLTVKILKEKAKSKGISMNSLLVNIVREQLGVKKKPRNIEYDDLNHLAGTWDSDDYVEFEENIRDFESIDESIWK